MGKKNPVAFVLRTPLYRPRKTKVVKGKGAYTRKTRHRSGRTDGVFFVSAHHRSRSLFPVLNSPATRLFLIPTK